MWVPKVRVPKERVPTERVPTQGHPYMGKNSIMIFPEEWIDLSINAPKEHQRIISKLTTGLGVLFYHECSIDLEPLPETMIDEGQTSPVPDVSLYNNNLSFFHPPANLFVHHKSQSTGINLHFSTPNPLKRKLSKPIDLYAQAWA